MTDSVMNISSRRQVTGSVSVMAGTLDSLQRCCGCKFRLQNKLGK